VRAVRRRVVNVVDFKPLAPHRCGFEFRQGLWILSCEEAIQLAYGTSLILLRHPFVPEIMYWMTQERRYMTYTLSMWRKTQSNKQIQLMICMWDRIVLILYLIFFEFLVISLSAPDDLRDSFRYGFACQTDCVRLQESNFMLQGSVRYCILFLFYVIHSINLFVTIFLNVMSCHASEHKV
jgi:hypothetical protein